MELSYWEYEQLTAPRDVIIIGAGIVGLSTAICLRERHPNMRVTVLDRAGIGCAASTRNAGFACFGSASELASDITKYGADEVLRVTNMRRAGLKKLLSLYGARDLGYVSYGGYELFRSEDVAEKNIAHIPMLNELLGESIFEVRDTPSGFRTYQRVIYNPQEAQLNTGMLYQTLTHKALSLNVEIMRGLEVTGIKQGHIVVRSTQGGAQDVEMRAQQIVIATNGLTSRYFEQVQVEAVRNQVLITRPIPGLQMRGTHHMDQGYLYFRNVGEDRILIGGGRQHHPEEATGEFGINDKNVEYLVDQLRQYILPESHVELPSSEIVDQSWSGILTGGNDRRPILERIDDHTVVAVRLGGIGVAIGVEIGAQAATLLAGGTLESL